VVVTKELFLFEVKGEEVKCQADKFIGTPANELAEDIF